MCIGKEKFLYHILTGENFELLDFEFFFFFFFLVYLSMYLESEHLKKVLKFTRQDKNYEETSYKKL